MNEESAETNNPQASASTAAPAAGEHASAAALRAALESFVEATERLHTPSWQPLRFELQLGRAALRGDASEKWLKVVEAARDLRDAARRSGADETGGRTLKALITAVDELDVF